MELKIQDITAAGKLLNEIHIQVARERCTLREIITARVKAEVGAYNQKKEDHFRGLVQPGETEQTLNGYRMKKKREIDAEQQVYVALDAFQRNGYFVLVDDEQAEDLDQEFLVNTNTSIDFIKLTPLVGG